MKPVSIIKEMMNEIGESTGQRPADWTGNIARSLSLNDTSLDLANYGHGVLDSRTMGPQMRNSGPADSALTMPDVTHNWDEPNFISDDMLYGLFAPTEDLSEDRTFQF